MSQQRVNIYNTPNTIRKGWEEDIKCICNKVAIKYFWSVGVKCKCP